MGEKATGMVRFYVSYLHPNQEIIIPVNSRVFANFKGEIVSFYTKHVGIINNYSPKEQERSNPFYNFYYTEILVECEKPGSIGNVPIGAVKYFDIPNINGVYNKESFDNGTDQQNDDSLREVIINTIFSSNLTEGGYKNLCFKNSNVKDVRVITSDNPQSFAPNLIGNIDIVVIPSKAETNVEIKSFSGGVIGFAKKPIKSILKIYKLKPDNSYDYLITNYQLIKDTNSIYRYSMFENTYLNVPGLSFGDKIEILYEYWVEIFNLQKMLEKSENKVIGANPIIRYGEVITPKIYFDVKLKLGYDFEEILENIKEKLVSVVNQFKFEETLSISDIIAISSIEGVDRIKNCYFILEQSNVDFDSQTIYPKIYQYIRLEKNKIFITME